MTSHAFPRSDIYIFLPLRHVDVRMTPYKNFIVGFRLRIQEYPFVANLTKIKQISWQICKFLHFTIPCHIHTRRLSWQLLRTMETVQNDPQWCKIKFEEFHFNILWCYGVIKESFLGAAESQPPPPPPGEVEFRISC